MRYLPLTQPDRDAMLSVVGASSIDDLFVDVPEDARLDGPIAACRSMRPNSRSSAT